MLVTGPAGSGKRLCAAAVAQALGVHVVQYSCHELVAASGRSDAKLAAAVTAAFETASEYAPAVLILRRFGALGGSAATGARARASETLSPTQQTPRSRSAPRLALA